jgi:Family of unknown function (DUF5898)
MEKVRENYNDPDVIDWEDLANTISNLFQTKRTVDDCRTKIVNLQRAEIKRLQEVESRNKEVESEIKRLQEVESRNKEVESEIKRLQEVESRNKSLERVNKNRSFESLLSVKQGKFQLRNVGKPSSATNCRHAEATAEEYDFPLAVFSLQENDTIRQIKVASRLLPVFVNEENEDNDSNEILQFNEKTFDSEMDVHIIVQLAVHDAVVLLKKVFFRNSLETTPSLKIKMERNLFSARPDILVVLHQDTPVFAVEVKKPISGNKLTGAKRVLGQAFDYTQLMEANGLSAPYVAISTFEESILCWPVPPNGQVSEIVPSETSAKTPCSKHSSATANEEETPSPPSVIPRSEISPLDQNKPNISHCDMKRELLRTTVYGPHQLVMLLYTGLSKAIDKNKLQPVQTICRLEKGKTYEFKKALRISAVKEYSWTELYFTVGSKIVSKDQTSTSEANIIIKAKMPVNHTPSEQEMEYFIIGALGYGSTSNVYQAIDSDGTVVAIKVFVNAGNEILDTKAFKECADMATAEEVTKFCLLYHDVLKDKVKVVNLFGTPCVVMPFFEPVEKKKREVCLERIQVVLTDRFLQNKVQYHADDVRWRHVGVYHDDRDVEHIILYDLADLVDVQDEAKMVDDHCSALRGRWPTEDVQQSGLFIGQQASED